jgi:hypothetical protein
MRMLGSSGSRRISQTACSPATRRSVSLCSLTVALWPGMDSVRRRRTYWPLRVAARAKNSAATWARRASAGPYPCRSPANRAGAERVRPFTTDEVAALLQVPLDTIHEWHKEGTGTTGIRCTRRAITEGVTCPVVAEQGVQG